ncbi:MAG: two-component system nitrogen regulation sensor histidine kinase GlnL [Alteromonadaceae bacterium]
MNPVPAPKNNHIIFSADKILRSIATAIIVLDDKLNIVFTNNASCQLLGQSEKRLIGAHFSQLFRHVSLTTDIINKALDQQKDFSDSEVHAVLSDSRPVLLTLNCSIVSRQGQLYALLEFRRIDAQQRLIQENQHENQHLAARGLIRGLAHEIKNPLGGIRGAAQLLQRQLTEDDLKEFTGLIIEQSDRLRNLVDRLLGPNKPPQWEYTNIHLVLNKTLQLITIEQGDSLTIKRDYDPSIPDIAVDPQLIQQALLNIFRNAVQAMDTHQDPPVLTVYTRIKHHQTINGRQHKIALSVQIIDNGPGIAVQLADTLFFPLVTDKPDGSGLGLSISQTLIHQHEGRIDCDSWPGHCQFSLLIPFKSINEVTR